MKQETRNFKPETDPKDFAIRPHNVCFLGFGNVNRTLAQLLADRAAELRDRYGIAFRITGVASRRLGWTVDPEGFELSQLCRAGTPALKSHANITEIRSWLDAAKADVLFEATSLNVENGQPAVDYIRAALEHGAHAITANKGTIVHAYRELRDLAARQGKRFLFESTVMDGVPIFSFFDQLPA
ncbi:MAG: hypothetical protein ACM3ND_08720, partial [Acidobacteriota bacterium]